MTAMTDTTFMRTWAEIDLDALDHNYRALRGETEESCRFLGLCKANAYGHGAAHIGPELQRLGAEMLAVACVDEAVELRRAGVTIPVLCLGQVPAQLAPMLAEHHVTQMVEDLDTGRALSAAAVAAGCEITVHVKIDTGMSRLGFLWRQGEDNSRVLDDIAALLALPGIGDYTAGAILSIAFGEPVPAVDGNVLRVAARLCDHAGDVLSPAVRRELTEQVRLWLPETAAGMFNQAIMELGETVCLPRTAPRCDLCPLRESCLGYAHGTAETLPVRCPRTTRRTEKLTVFVCLSDGPQKRVLLHRRPDTGLLAGLWELPNLPDGDAPTPDEWAAQQGLSVYKTFPLPAGRHLFTHVEWQMTGFALLCREPVLTKNGVWVTEEHLKSDYALPSAFHTYSRALPAWLHQND